MMTAHTMTLNTMEDNSIMYKIKVSFKRSINVGLFAYISKTKLCTENHIELNIFD